MTNAEDSAASTTSTSGPPAASGSFSLFSIINWVCGGLSLLNLTGELTKAKLYGQLYDWIEAYRHVVAWTSETLFGWINWRWLSVSQNEAHVLILASIVASALIRSSVNMQVAKGESRLSATIYTSIAGVLAVVAMPFIAAVLLPDPYGLVVSAILLSIRSAIHLFIFRSNKPGVTPPPAIVRREIMGVLAVTILLVAVNYMFLKP